MMRVPIERVNLLEKDIEDWLWENPHELDDQWYEMVRWIGRQVRLPNGIADLVGFCQSRYSHHHRVCPVVVEVKNVPIKTDALGQVARYASDILGVFDKGIDTEESMDSPVDFRVRKIVVGTDIDNTTFNEAIALQTIVYTFEASVSVDLGSGPLSWTDSYLEERSEQLRSIAEGSEILDALSWARARKAEQEALKNLEKESEDTEEPNSRANGHHVDDGVGDEVTTEG